MFCELWAITLVGKTFLIYLERVWEKQNFEPNPFCFGVLDIKWYHVQAWFSTPQHLPVETSTN